MSKKHMTNRQFDQLFPSDDACLEHIFRTRYGDRFDCPKCGKEAHYYRVASRRCHECEHCGHQVYATVGTPFEKSRTSLRTWFQVMFMFCTTRNGVAAKEIQRATGVTYKTAWRMGHEIRKYMAYVDGDAPLGGDGPGYPIVEADKAFIGGKDKRGKDDKAVVLGMVERKGNVLTRVVKDRRATSVLPVVAEFVKPGSRVATDEAKAFGDLRSVGYRHGTINHRKGEYVRGSVHTNTIEAFWANLKRGIKGTHVWVSKKHLSSYLGEFEFRHNLRRDGHLMLDVLLLAFPRAASQTASREADDQSVA
ncbi:MAG: IS1595 family transposase [Pseudomonadota bacterium]|nr:IS1595 family transposase [Pseudomonadota bacterium]